MLCRSNDSNHCGSPKLRHSLAVGTIDGPSSIVLELAVEELVDVAGGDELSLRMKTTCKKLCIKAAYAGSSRV